MNINENIGNYRRITEKFSWDTYKITHITTARCPKLQNLALYLFMELVDTNAYKLQPSLSERVTVDRHGCHTALHFDVKAKENQDKVPTIYWLPKLHKNPIKQDLLLILVLERQQNFLNC